MSKVSHTPGPWIWADNYNGLYGAGPDNAVLDYENYEGMDVRGWTPRGEANARLIAAAPDLLATVKECLATMAVMAEQISQMEGMFDDNDGSIAAALKDFDNAHEMASTAIAKAMGEDEV